MKKIIVLLLAVIMVFSLFACAPAQPPVNNNSNNSNNSNDGGNTNDDNSSEVPGITFPLAQQETLTISIQLGGGTLEEMNQQLAANVLWQEILTKTNVRFEFVIWNESNIAAMFQTGKMGDLVICGGSGKTNLFNTFIADGLLLPLEDYASSKALMPNLNKYVFEELPEAKAAFTSADGHIYSLGGYDANKIGYLEYPLWINQKWLDKCGLDIPTTFEELEAALTACKGDMNGNGRPDEIPCLMSSLENRGVEMLLSMWGIATKDGANDNYVYVEDGEVKFVPQTETYKRFIKKMNEWWENGLLYRDVFTGDYGTVQALYLADVNDDVKVGLIGINNIATVRNAEDYVCLTPMPAEEGVEVSYQMHPGFMGNKTIFSIPKTSGNPELACAVMDLFYSPEYTIRSQYGETDSIWRNTNADGTFTPVTPDADTVAANRYTAKNKFDDANGYKMQFPTAKGKDFYELYQISEADQRRVDALAQYEDAGVIADEIWPRPGYTAEGAETVAELRTDIFKLVETKRAAWITGQADIDAEWDDFQDDLISSDVEDFIDALQEAYDVWKQARDSAAK